MLKTELLEIIANGENSGVEFQRDDIRPEQLAKEVVAMANFQGGRILLGVEDDGVISGVQRSDLEEWVMNVFQSKIHIWTHSLLQDPCCFRKKVKLHPYIRPLCEDESLPALMVLALW